MPDPSAASFLRLLEFIRGAYAAADPDAFLRHALSGLQTLIACDATLCADLTAANKVSVRWVRPSALHTPGRCRRWERDLQVIADYYLATGDGNARKTSDFAGRLRTSAVALTTRERNALASHALLATVLPDGRPRILALHCDEGDFTETDRRLLNLARPQLLEAYRALMTEARLRKQLALVLHGQHQMLQGVILLSPEGRLMEANEPAVRALREFFGPTRIGRLPEALQIWSTETANARREPMVLHRGDRRLTIHQFGTQTEKLLLLEEEQRGIRGETLRNAGGLTKREADVLAWVTEGKTNAVIGEIMGISARTVQTHLIHVYAKLGVETRTAAAAWALAISRRR